jgi:ankyrin repeat protein
MKKILDKYGNVPISHSGGVGRGTFALFISALVLLSVSGCATSTTLHHAAEAGNIEEVRRLIKEDADVNKVDKEWSTPLHEASFKGHADIARLLIEKGADATIPATLPSLGKKTPLEIAEKLNRTIILRMIKEAGKKPIKLYTKEEKSSQETTLIPKSDVDEPPEIKVKPNKNSYAIVIGIEQYRQKLPKADFAAHDAKTMTEYLTKVMGYPEENVVTLLNDRALKSDMEKYFEK